MQSRGTDDIVDVKVTAQEKDLAKECRVSLLQMPVLSPAFKIFLELLTFPMYIYICCNIYVFTARVSNTIYSKTWSCQLLLHSLPVFSFSSLKKSQKYY